MKGMFCFVNDMVYMGVKLQVLIKYHTKEPHIWGVEYFRVIDVIGVNGGCFLQSEVYGESFVHIQQQKVIGAVLRGVIECSLKVVVADAHSCPMSGGVSYESVRF